MATYGFDGVDIDWEYPAADDRDGRKEDFANLPKFLSNIKSALKQSGERNGLSIAIPASYWYLQHFDLEKISKYVDHFNVMTYDFHGAWDTPKSWLGNHLNSHTNLTEIRDAFDLLWRNKVNPAQVNMGLAFYARTFYASSSGCMSPGCLFDAGGPAEPCTDAVGVMSNPEIMRKLGGKIGQGDLDKTAAVKTLKFGRTWLTYGDVDTWKLKLDFARSQCLGGAMATGYKSKGVTTFMTRKPIGGGVFLETSQSEANADVSDDQCRWTNCAQTCPRGWSTVQRRDPYRTNSREIMMDDTGCDGNGSRTWCCPPGKQPFCQWESHNKGDCSPGCREGELEVASFAKSCGNGKAQTACCRGDTPALDVYRQYQWFGRQRTCAIDSGEKPCGWSAEFDTMLVSSWDGSGAQVCYDSDDNKGPRPLCEDTGDETKPHFKNCDWSDDHNLGRTDIVSEGQCSSDCPSGKVKVTLDSQNNLCGKGTSAFCCDVGVSFDYTDINDEDMEDLVKRWAKNPTCPELSGLQDDKPSTRSLDNNTLSIREQLSQLAKRQGLHTLTPERAIVLIIQRLMELPKKSRATRDIQKLIDKYFTPIWPHITGAWIAGKLWEFRNDISTLKSAFDFVCNIDAEEKQAKLEDEFEGNESSFLFCNISSLDTYGPTALVDPREGLSDSEISDLSHGIDSALNGFKWPFTEWGWSAEWLEGEGLEKRGSGTRRTFKPMCPDGTTSTIKSEPYPNGEKGAVLAKKNGDDKMFYVKDTGDCISASIEDDGKPNDGKEWIGEHILELQTIPMFIEFSMGVHNKLYNHLSPSKLDIVVPDNPTKAANRPSCSMWSKGFTEGFPAWDAKNKETPVKGLFTLLGSTTNTKHMVNAEKKLNNLKASVWSFNEPVAGSRWDKKYAATNKKTAQHAFEQLTLVEQIFAYLLKAGVNEKFVASYKDVGNFLEEFEELYRKEYPKTPVLGLSNLWTVFMKDLMGKMQKWTKTWLKHRTEKMEAAWKAEAIRRLEAVGKAKTPQSAAKALAYQKEAVDIMDKATVHKLQHGVAIDKFKPDDVFPKI